MISIAILTPVVLAIVEAIKRGDFFPKKYLPFASILVAILLAVITRHIGEPMGDVVIMGITSGLMAVGLFSGAKSVLKK